MLNLTSQHEWCTAYLDIKAIPFAELTLRQFDSSASAGVLVSKVSLVTQRPGEYISFVVADPKNFGTRGLELVDSDGNIILRRLTGGGED